MKSHKPSFFLTLFSFHLPTWMDLRILAIPVLLAVFLLAMSWSEPLPMLNNGNVRPGLATPIVPAGHGQSPTPIPEEWAKNGGMSNGIVLGAVVLVLIIVGGTVDSNRRH